MSLATSDIVIIGGGVIGMSMAWRLRQRGATVTVLERGGFPFSQDHDAPRGQATWASGGMLAPLGECGSQSALLDAGLASLKLYPDFLQELSHDAGLEIMLQGPGLLRVNTDSDGIGELDRLYEWQKDLGLPLHRLSAADAERLEPALAGLPGSATLSPAEKHIPPRILLHALTVAARHTGVRLISHCPAEGFRAIRDEVLGVDTPRGTVTGGHYVFAAGAWGGELARQLGLMLPVRPIRGQAVILRCAMLLSHTIYSHQGYLVPRADGSLFIGATQDDVGFNSAPTVEGVQSLLRFATQLVPSLTHARFESAAAGLRPDSPDGLPILGAAPGWSNVSVASGHFRNGILLTPFTASSMSGFILTGHPEPALEPFRPDRFQ